MLADSMPPRPSENVADGVAEVLPHLLCQGSVAGLQETAALAARIVPWLVRRLAPSQAAPLCAAVARWAATQQLDIASSTHPDKA